MVIKTGKKIFIGKYFENLIFTQKATKSYFTVRDSKITIFDWTGMNVDARFSENCTLKMMFPLKNDF